MKNKSNLFKIIRNIIVGNTLPKNEDLWLDTSNGEKNAVLKYKGNSIAGGGGPSNIVIKATLMTEEELELVVPSKGTVTGGYKIPLVDTMPYFIEMEIGDGIKRAIMDELRYDDGTLIAAMYWGRNIIYAIPGDWASLEVAPYNSSALPEGFMYYILLS